LLLISALALAGCRSRVDLTPVPGALGFDGATVGWRAGSTGGEGPMASWLQRPDRDAITPPNVLAVASTNAASPTRANLYWSESARFQDGILAVALRVDDGELARGGGLLWRARDEQNYYVAHVAFDEQHGQQRVAIEAVERGVRRELAHRMIDPPVDVARWHRLEVEQRGERIECWFAGRHVLQVRDRTHMFPGGVGLCTFADARTSFDDLLVSANMVRSLKNR